MEVQLPFRLQIKRVEGNIYGNGEKLTSEQMSQINTPWLIGSFEFQSPNCQSRVRTTGHRLKLALSENIDSEYFNGQIYNDYNSDSVSLPKEIFNKIEKFTNTKGKFLDVGCATGLTVKYALEKGYDARGVDFSSWAVEQANKLTADRCRVCNFDEATSAEFSAPYDVISMHSVIEHLKLPERAINLLFELCASDGIVFLQTLNADSLMHSVMKKDWGGYTDYTHQSPWITADWLVETAEKCGFEVLSVRRYHLWNDNIYDNVWRALTDAFQSHPLDVLLEDDFGDAVELILRKPLSFNKT
ncbi:MAG: class I SAM-dependent methyltransferase [Pyrinomonadaceae bacterium]|nr:class I SAM-dependent methyltransferase [Pyrinomonadaceae bacterium]